MLGGQVTVILRPCPWDEKTKNPYYAPQEDCQQL
jgi:hypothetical protein